MLACLAGMAPAHALTLLSTDGLTSPIPLTRLAEIRRDPTGTLTIADVSSHANGAAFEPINSEIIQPATSSSVAWLSFSLSRSPDGPQRWVLHVRPPSLDRVTLYIPDDRGGFRSTEAGDRLPFSTRDVRHQDIVFRLPLNAEEQRFFLRVESSALNTLVLSVWQLPGFVEYEAQQDLLMGITLGAIGAMFFLNLIFWRWLGDSLYLHYAGLLAATACLALFATGYAVRWSSAYPLAADYGYGIALCLYNIVAISFINRIFELRRHWEWAWRVFAGAAGLKVLALLVALSGHFDMVNWAINALTLAVAIFGTGLIFDLVIVRRQHQYIVPVAAFSISAVACVVRASEVLGITNFGFDGSMDLRLMAAVTHLVLLNIAVANRTRVAEMNYRRERSRVLNIALQSERDLETKIKIRTQKLAEANGALQKEVARRNALEARMMMSLRAERETLEQQRQFVSMVSHEFRTPLAVIEATTDSLNLSPVGTDPSVQPRTDKIKRAVNRLSLLIDNVLAKDKLDRGDLPQKQVELFGVRDLVLGVQSSQADRDAERLRVKMGTDPMPIQGDRALLEIALQNLVQNALKYSPPGSDVCVDVHLDAGSAQIDVQDGGSGISDLELPYIFQKYFRASGQRRRPGSGIGLHISREIARQHGGDILLVSTSALGSNFRLSLPIRQPDPQGAPPVALHGGWG